MKDANLAETQQTLIPTHPQHQQRQRQNQQFEGGENSDHCVDRKTGCITESHRKTRRQHLHLQLQLRSGPLRNGKRVGAHGNLHHLRNGGDFGFLERIPENRRGVWTGHTLTTHICARSANPKTCTLRTYWWTTARVSMCALHEILSGSPLIRAGILTRCRRTTLSNQYR